MAKSPIITFLLLGSALSACTTATIAPTAPLSEIGTASYSNSGHTYSVTVASTTYDLGLDLAHVASGTYGDLRFDGFQPGAFARGYRNIDMVAVGGMLVDGTTFAGVSGTTSAPVPTTGTATYTGSWTAAYAPTVLTVPVGVINGSLTATADFAAGTLNSISGGASALTFTSTINGTSFTGTATCNYPTGGCAVTVPLEGGFYGTNAIGAAFAGTGLAGVIYATTP